MPRPSQRSEKRAALLPVLARAFAELGYRRSTSAELAKRCRVQENVLYRLWPDKQAMFVAAIEHVFETSRCAWERVLAAAPGDAAARLLTYEARHLGEHGLYRLLFAGLSETEDVVIRAALRRTYGRFHAFLRQQIELHRGQRRRRPEIELAAWAILGVGTAGTIARELELLSARGRARMLRQSAGLLLEGLPLAAKRERSKA